MFCLQTHLPGYVKEAEAIKAKGIKEVVCVSVNDPFVMGAWGKVQETEGKVSTGRQGKVSTGKRGNSG